MRHTGIIRINGCFIGGVDDRTRAVTLIKAQAGTVFFEQLFIRARFDRVRQTLEKKAFGIQCSSFPANMIIKCSAEAAAGILRGNPVQVTEADLRLMQQHREAQNFVTHVFGDKKNGSKPLLERIAQFAADFIDLFAGDIANAPAQQAFHLAQGILIDRQHIIINATYFQHGFGFPAVASQRIRSTASANVRPDC